VSYSSETKNHILLWKKQATWQFKLDSLNLFLWKTVWFGVENSITQCELLNVIMVNFIASVTKSNLKSGILYATLKKIYLYFDHSVTEIINSSGDYINQLSLYQVEKGYSNWNVEWYHVLDQNMHPCLHTSTTVPFKLKTYFTINSNFHTKYFLWLFCMFQIHCHFWLHKKNFDWKKIDIESIRWTDCD